MRRIVLTLLALLTLFMAAQCATSKPPVVLPAAGFYQDVAWSRDGRQIAYSMLVDNRWAVYTSAADGSHAQRISPDDRNCVWSTWSPDGTRLAFSCGSKEKTDVWIANLSSGERHPLTNDGSSNSAPSWSPGGTSIAFTKKVNGHSVVMTMAPDGTSPVALTAESSNAWNPVFSPDGRRIVYYSDAAGGDQLYVVDVNSRSVRAAGAGNQHEIFPSWTPAGDLLASIDRSIVVIHDGKVVATVGDGYFARISPGGRRIAIISGKYPTSSVTISRWKG